MSVSRITSTTSSSSITTPGAEVRLLPPIHLAALTVIVSRTITLRKITVSAVPPRSTLKFCSSNPSDILIISSKSLSPEPGEESSTRDLICHPLCDVCRITASPPVGDRSTTLSLPSPILSEIPIHPSSGLIIPYCICGPLGPTKSKKT